MRTFEIVNAKGRRKFPVAWLEYNPDDRNAIIRIAETAEVGHVPAMFDYFIETGARELDRSWTLKWIQERIPPPNRHNIDDILDSAGLEEYDPFSLLFAAAGRSAQDDFYLREVDSPSYEYAIVSLQATVGDKVRQARTEAGLSQQQLAYRSGIQQAMLSKIENGKVNLTLETISCLAHAMDKHVQIDII